MPIATKSNKRPDGISDFAKFFNAKPPHGFYIGTYQTLIGDLTGIFRKRLFRSPVLIGEVFYRWRKKPITVRLKVHTDFKRFKKASWSRAEAFERKSGYIVEFVNVR